MSEVVVHKLDRDSVVEHLLAWGRDELSARPEVAKAVLIGSLATGEWSARSDADVVLIVDAAERSFRDRGGEYRPNRNPGVAVDLFVYTDKELSTWGPRFRQAVSDGIVLYTRPQPSP